jgi:hypothetical protein
LSGLTDITFDVDWINNCIEFNNAYVFYRGYSYAAGPNPATDFVTITEEGGKNPSADKQKDNGRPGIKSVSVFDYNNSPVASYKLDGGPTARIDISNAPPGIVYLVIEGSAENPVTLKMVKR